MGGPPSLSATNDDRPCESAESIPLSRAGRRAWSRLVLALALLSPRSRLGLLAMLALACPSHSPFAARPARGSRRLALARSAAASRLALAPRCSPFGLPSAVRGGGRSVEHCSSDVHVRMRTRKVKSAFRLESSIRSEIQRPFGRGLCVSKAPKLHDEAQTPLTGFGLTCHAPCRLRIHARVGGTVALREWMTGRCVSRGACFGTSRGDNVGPPSPEQAPSLFTSAASERAAVARGSRSLLLLVCW